MADNETSFSEDRVPHEAKWTATMARSVGDRSAAGDHGNAVADAAEAILAARRLFDGVVAAAVLAGMSWTDLASYARDTPEELERVQQRFSRKE